MTDPSLSPLILYLNLDFCCCIGLPLQHVAKKLNSDPIVYYTIHHCLYIHIHLQ